MPRKIVEENERIKREYLTYRREAKRNDHKTVDKAADAIRGFEESTKVTPFKKFHIQQAISFKDQLNRAVNRRTGKPLSKRHIDGTLRAVKAFFVWLAGRPGYKRAIRYADTEYFNLNAKDSRVAHAHRDAPFPTLAQCDHAFRLMPEASVGQRRDKAAFAFLMMTGARGGALASFRLKFVDLKGGCVYQDAREVKTKFSKSFPTWFFPVDPMYRAFFEGWMRELQEDRLFGHEDALFPKPPASHVDGKFSFESLSRDPYSDQHHLGEIIKGAFVAASLPPFTPHSFRKTLMKLGNDLCETPEELKAWSQNLGHENLRTSIESYLPVSGPRQGQLIRKLAQRKPRDEDDDND